MRPRFLDVQDQLVGLFGVSGELCRAFVKHGLFDTKATGRNDKLCPPGREVSELNPRVDQQLVVRDACRIVGTGKDQGVGCVARGVLVAAL